MSKRPTTKKTGHDMMTEALHQQILDALAEGITAASLRKIQRLAAMGGELLAVAAGPEALLRNRGFGGPLTMTNAMYPTVPSMVGAVQGPFNDDDDPNEPMAPSPASENFGARAIREIVSAATEFTRLQNAPSMTQMVNAIVIARAEKLDSVADALEANLLSTVRPPASLGPVVGTTTPITVLPSKVNGSAVAP